jgi:uncharacterized membrane protein
LFPLALIGLFVWHRGGRAGLELFAAMLASLGVLLAGVGLFISAGYFGNTAGILAGLGLAFAGAASAILVGTTWLRNRQAGKG